jgi:hypothetical protein
MILLNFAHPLTEDQLAAILLQINAVELDIRGIKTHFDHERPFPTCPHTKTAILLIEREEIT